MEAFELQSTVPFLHVADVQVSIDFYLKFGLLLESRFGAEGDPFWARMKRPGCDLMLAKASGPIDSEAQAAMIYMHVSDVRAFRSFLLSTGLEDGGAFHGEHAKQSRKGVVFSLTSPFYMPAGEVRIHDPDGYVILVGELGEPK